MHFGIVFRICVFVLFGVALYGALFHLEANRCSMTYMHPNYNLILSEGGYGFGLYKEGPFGKTVKVGGVPVLFIPGNAGSGYQVRSLGSQAARTFSKDPLPQEYYDSDTRQKLNFPAFKPQSNELDYFYVHFEEELSAFDGSLLKKQTEFVVRCLNYIATLYPASKQEKLSMFIVGHSMGGIVARAAALSGSLVNVNVNTLITFSTPHKQMPVHLSRSLVQFYDEVNTMWNQSLNPNISLVSISGGARDIQVREDLSMPDSFCPESNCFSVVASGIPGVKCSTDHLASVWCNQLVDRVTAALFAILDKEGKPLEDLHTRMGILHNHFFSNLWPLSKMFLPTQHSLHHRGSNQQSPFCTSLNAFGFSQLLAAASDDSELRMERVHGDMQIVWAPKIEYKRPLVIVSDAASFHVAVLDPHCQDISHEVEHVAAGKPLSYLLIPPPSNNAVVVITPQSHGSFLIASTVAPIQAAPNYWFPSDKIRTNSLATSLKFQSLPFSSFVPSLRFKFTTPTDALFLPILIEINHFAYYSPRLIPLSKNSEDVFNGEGAVVIADIGADIISSVDIMATLAHLIRFYSDYIPSVVVALCLCRFARISSLFCCLLLVISMWIMHAHIYAAVTMVVFSWSLLGGLELIVFVVQRISLVILRATRLFSSRIIYGIVAISAAGHVSFGLFLISIFLTTPSPHMSSHEQQSRRLLSLPYLLSALLQLPSFLSLIRRAQFAMGMADVYTMLSMLSLIPALELAKAKPTNNLLANISVPLRIVIVFAAIWCCIDAKAVNALFPLSILPIFLALSLK